MNTNFTPEQSAWPEAMATVAACKYDFGAGRALAFGVPTTKHFRISYNYFAEGELHTGEFASAKAVPQGELFPIRYNPEAAHDHAHQLAPSQSTRSPILLVGILGSVVLSLAWFAVLRGCR